MFLDNISQNIDILVVINVWKNNFGFHSNRKTQGQKHQVNNLYFKYQVCHMKLRHLNTFLQFRLLYNKPHCTHSRMLGNLLWRNEWIIHCCHLWLLVAGAMTKLATLTFWAASFSGLLKYKRNSLHFPSGWYEQSFLGLGQLRWIGSLWSGKVRQTVLGRNLGSVHIRCCDCEWIFV